MNMDKTILKQCLGNTGARIELSFLIKFDLIFKIHQISDFFHLFHCVFIVQEKYATMTRYQWECCITCESKQYLENASTTLVHKLNTHLPSNLSEDLKYIKWRFFSIFHFVFIILTESAIMRMYHMGYVDEYDKNNTKTMLGKHWCTD